MTPIHHTFAPHVDARYLLRTIALLCTPWRWKRGIESATLRDTLAKKFSADAFLFASGREGLLALLRSMHLLSGEEIIIQGYTCVAVPNAVHAGGAVPVYADIDRETLNLDPTVVERAITPRTRAVICQHTFGIPADTARLRAICTAHNLLLIEDCAHIIPDDRGPASIGAAGDAVLLSFGRDKAVSGIAGGAILTRKKELSDALRNEEDRAKDYAWLFIMRLLLYPLVYAVARPLYGCGIGKIFLRLCRMIGALVPIVTDDEKEGAISPLLHRMPNACAALALAEFRNLQTINDHRRLLTRLFLEEGKKRSWPMLRGVTADLPLQKFPLFVRNAAGIRASLKRNNIHLDDGWTGCVVCPIGVDMDATSYVPGSDPDAEAAAEMILSLPTHPTMTERHAAQLVATLDPLLHA